jgi:hypothetical protein
MSARRSLAYIGRQNMHKSASAQRTDPFWAVTHCWKMQHTQ